MLLTRIRLGFSHLNDHRFRHNFENCINPLYSCSLVTEDTLHYLLHRQPFSQCDFDFMNSENQYLIVLSLCLTMIKKILLYVFMFLLFYLVFVSFLKKVVLYLSHYYRKKHSVTSKPSSFYFK